nr:GIY-YIG nuclease family protein [uncultured Flavobacterium sp.]
MFLVYTLYSNTRSKFYIGQTNELPDSLKRYNSSESLSTKSSISWKIIYSVGFETRVEIMALERKIKKWGAARYLRDVQYKYAL